MDERLQKTIRGLKDWDELAILQRNVKNKSAFTDEVAAALKARAVELGRVYVAEKTGLVLPTLTPAMERIVVACAEYAAVLRRQGKHPRRTIEQIRKYGFIEAAEISVSRSSQTQGFQVLADEDLQELSYEQIIVDHAGEFSPRAVWYARRTLGLPNAQNQPPAAADNETQLRCLAVLDWYEQTAAKRHGRISGHTNSAIASVLGLDDTRVYGRVLGNIQSRIDFACYECRLPPLGLTAEAPYADAWGQGDRNWFFPIAAMQRAAQTHTWVGREFEALRRSLEWLPGQAYISWRAALEDREEDVQTWAFSFGDESDPGTALPHDHSEQDSSWSRDELILALDFYFQYTNSIRNLGPNELQSLVGSLSKVRKQVSDSAAVADVTAVQKVLQIFTGLDEGVTTQENANGAVLSVWLRFSADRKHLTETADAIRAALNDPPDEAGDIDFPDTEEAEEGRLLTRSHRTRERSQGIVLEKKRRAMKENGVLRCEACGFHFPSKYGAESASIIDCHHTKPVHTLREGDKTHIDDLALLCANCHRVVHASKRWLTIEELKSRLAQAVNGSSTA